MSDLSRRRFMVLVSVFTFAVILLSQGCATEGKSLALGGGIGAGAGALLGGIADPGKNGEFRTRNVIVGATLGGMAGMVTGSLVHQNTEEKRKDAYLAGQQSIKSAPGRPAQEPKLDNAQVKTYWVEDRVVGNRFVDGHYEHVIEAPARWSESQ